MWELITAGGWVMLPILLCSIIAVAIVAERLWCLQPERIAPADLLQAVWRQRTLGQLDDAAKRRLKTQCALGRIMVTAIDYSDANGALMRERIEETAQVEARQLDRYLNTLGTIAAITPLLGLLGTVLGMINVFSAIDAGQAAAYSSLAGGIGEALVTTGAGLMIAIPSVVAHRYLRGRVNQIIYRLEHEAIRFAELIERGGERPIGQH